MHISTLLIGSANIFIEALHASFTVSKKLKLDALNIRILYKPVAVNNVPKILDNETKCWGPIPPKYRSQSIIDIHR